MSLLRAPTTAAFRSVNLSLATLIPPATALLYPWIVASLYRSGQLLEHASGPLGSAIAWAATILAGALVYGVPAVSLAVAAALAPIERPSAVQLLARRAAHLAFASPSLFVLIGVVFYLLHRPSADYLAWTILWLAVIGVVAASPHKAATASEAAPSWLRVAHGFSALAIVLIFLAWHLANHMSALWSLATNEALMKVLRSWYRSDAVQPLLVALVIFQVISGARLLWARTAVSADFARTVQSLTGAFLMVYLASHMTAVFILGRTVLDIDTNFRWASGAPAGLLPDAWNVRLIPHYSLGVWVAITHLGMGLRVILLNHRIERRTAERVAWSVCGIGLVISLVITAAQLSVRG
jgi:succinate dehydrogenase/fumarate reductase cytochrome b subunit